MADYLLVPDGLANNYKGNAKRDSEELLWKAINPVSVKSPPNHSVLPTEVLDDPDIVEAFPALSGLENRNDSNLEFWESDDEGNRF